MGDIELYECKKGTGMCLSSVVFSFRLRHLLDKKVVSKFSLSGYRYFTKDEQYENKT